MAAVERASHTSRPRMMTDTSAACRSDFLSTATPGSTSRGRGRCASPARQPLSRLHSPLCSHHAAPVPARSDSASAPREPARLRPMHRRRLPPPVISFGSSRHAYRPAAPREEIALASDAPQLPDPHRLGTVRASGQLATRSRQPRWTALPRQEQRSSRLPARHGGIWTLTRTQLLLSRQERYPWSGRHQHAQHRRSRSGAGPRQVQPQRKLLRWIAMGRRFRLPLSRQPKVHRRLSSVESRVHVSRSAWNGSQGTPTSPPSSACERSVYFTDAHRSPSYHQGTLPETETSGTS